MRISRFQPQWKLAGGKCSAAPGWLLACLFASSLSAQPLLTRADLDRSLELGTGYLLANQLPDGQFAYLYHLARKSASRQTDQVREAGALWGVSLIHLDHPTDRTRDAVQNALSFFRGHSKKTEQGGLYVAYPGETRGRTGTTALVTLGLIDFLRAESGGGSIPTASQEEYSKDLDGYLAFLLSLRNLEGHFASGYLHENGAGVGSPSPYFDGETLLTLSKAAKYLPGHEGLKDRILESAASMHTRHVVQGLQAHPDSAQTKGFFQWGILSYYELFTSGWEGTQIYGQRAIDLAHWMIDVHKTLERTKNTAYAIEGIATAHEIAGLIGDPTSQAKFADVTRKALAKLTSWQAGHPLQNRYLSTFTDLGRGLGGVMNSERDPDIRVDVVQHQLHAILLTRRFVLKE